MRFLEEVLEENPIPFIRPPSRLNNVTLGLSGVGVTISLSVYEEFNYPGLEGHPDFVFRRNHFGDLFVRTIPFTSITYFRLVRGEIWLYHLATVGNITEARVITLTEVENGEIQRFMRLIHDNEGRHLFENVLQVEFDRAFLMDRVAEFDRLDAARVIGNDEEEIPLVPIFYVSLRSNEFNEEHNPHFAYQREYFLIIFADHWNQHFRNNLE